MVFALPIGALFVLTFSHGFSVGAARFFLMLLFIVLTPSLPTALLICCLRTGRVLSTVFGSLLGAAVQIATFAVTGSRWRASRGSRQRFRQGSLSLTH
jgi:hypothetical protein